VHQNFKRNWVPSDPFRAVPLACPILENRGSQEKSENFN
jgi:hypothetical protein